MDFCLQAKMVSGVSHRIGSVALLIWMSLDPWFYEPLAAGLITRGTLPICFQDLETNIVKHFFYKFRFHLQHKISVELPCFVITLVIIKECFGNHMWSFGSKFVMKLRWNLETHETVRGPPPSIYYLQ